VSGLHARQLSAGGARTLASARCESAWYAKAMIEEVARLRSEVKAMRRMLIGTVLAFIACATTQTQAVPPASKPAGTPAVLDVERINIREPDGTIRLAISNGARAPGPIVDTERGEEDDRVGGNGAGLVFYNEEGSENGALYFDGDSVGLSLDRQHQDQTIVLAYGEEAEGYFSGLLLYERPDYPHKETLKRVDAVAGLPADEAKAQMRQMQDSGAFGTYRMMVAKDEHGAAIIELADRRQRARLRMSVDATGSPRLQFLDEDGAVTYALPPQ